MPTRRSFDIFANFFSRHVLEIMLVLLFAYMTLEVPAFASSKNIFAILRNMSVYGVIACPMMMVIIMRDIDLSIGSTIALAGVIVALSSKFFPKLVGMPVGAATVLGIFLALLAAVPLGLFVGMVVTRFQLPAFIVTLAMQFVVYGVTAVICGGFPQTILTPWFRTLGTGRLFDVIPIPVIILLVVFFFFYFVMEHTKFGRYVYAIGGNPEAARLAGVNVTFVKVTVYVLVQITAVIAGVILSSTVMAGSALFGRTYEMTVITACVIGGTSMQGGIGSVRGTFIGLVFLGVILNGMTLLRIDEYVQYIVRGGLVLVAVFLNTWQVNRLAKQAK